MLRSPQKVRSEVLKVEGPWQIQMNHNDNMLTQSCSENSGLSPSESDCHMLNVNQSACHFSTSVERVE